MPESSPSPTRVVADSDVLAADLFCDGSSREVLDRIRAHSWLTLVASDELLDDAETVIRELGDAELARDWRATIETLVERVDQPSGDHPALASAYQGGAMHVISFDERLTGLAGNRHLRGRLEATVRHPDAFARVFDPAKLYPEVGDGDYPGPDREPRA
jgi:predicted nucleic acid-binding protein